MLLATMIAVLIFGGCASATSGYSGSHRDLSLISSIKANCDKYESDRSILYVEKNYLTKNEVIQLHQRIDKAIVDIENALNIKFNTKIYKKNKIEYFVHSKKEPSHTITAYQPKKYMHPVIFLTFAKEKRAPYVHETVHIIAWDWNTLWIKEGLAVFLNDKLNGYPSFPNRKKDIDKGAKYMLQFKSVLRMIGKNGIPRFSSKKERYQFYILAGSFVKYLYNNIEISKLMKIYTSQNTNRAFVKLTKKDVSTWKKEWIDYLKTKI
jgi:hypothetical protein